MSTWAFLPKSGDGNVTIRTQRGSSTIQIVVARRDVLAGVELEVEEIPELVRVLEAAKALAAAKDGES